MNAIVVDVGKVLEFNTMLKKYHAVLFTGCPTLHVKPFGAHKIAHELRIHGFDTLVVNFVETFTIEEIKQVLDQCISDKTLFVGISSTFLTHGASLTESTLLSTGKNFFHGFLPQGHEFDQQFVDHIKSINSECKIVIGGTRTHPNYRNPLVDFVIIGYADVSAVQLAKFLQSGEPIGVHNYKNIYKVHIIEDKLAETFDFNNSTMTWCDDDVIIPGEVLPLEISRGCIFKCKFCSFRLNGKKSVDYLKQAEIIEKELLENYHRYGTTMYWLLDDTFNDTEEKIDVIANIVKKLPFQPLFSGYIRLDLLTAKPHTIPKLFDMGFRHMYFGIETLNKKTGSIIGKGGDPDRMVQTIIDMKKTYGQEIHFTGSFICGLPGESKEDVLRTMAKLIFKKIPVDRAVYYPLVIYKENAHVWSSGFDLDYKKYGYVEIEDTTNSDPIMVLWKNEHMTWPQALEMTKQFAKKYRNTNTKPNEAIFNNFKPDTLTKNYKQQLLSYLNPTIDV